MHIVRNRLGNTVLTSTTDSGRARALCAGFEQLDIVPDLGGRWHYWFASRNGLAWRHPYDVEAQNRLQAEFERLKAAHLAGLR